MKQKYLKGIGLLILIFLSQNIFAQTPLTNSTFESQINSYLDDTKTQYNLNENDFSDLVISKQFYTSKTKLEHIYLVQRYQNIEIFNSETSVAIKDSKVFYFANRFQPDISEKINTITPNLNAQQAIEKAALHFNLQTPSNLEAIQSSNNKEFLFSNGGISQENIPVKLVFLPKEGQLRLSWDLSIYTLDSTHWWSVRVDAVSGEIIDVSDWVLTCNYNNLSNYNANNFVEKQSSFTLFNNLALVADGSQYNVLPIPADTPEDGSFQLITNPSNDVASRFGWHDDDGNTGADYTITQGNNVIAQEDINGDNGTGYSPDGGATLDFNFSIDLNTQQPADYRDTAITNLFYMNNMMHDIWYQYGFDRESGNFQENHYDRVNAPGQGDPVFADAQDGGGTNNANFGTPPDGSSPRMQMFLWDIFSSPPITINNGALMGDYGGSPATAFGAAYPDAFPITADVVLVEDDNSGGTSTDPNDACDVITNGSSLSGKVAILRRGDCEFGFKVLAAENEGAIAVILVNNAAGPVNINMQPGAVGGSVTIPSIIITQTDGEAIITELNNANTVNVTLSQTVDYRDGDFANGIIAHEYGHGISNRLTGGAADTNCLNNNEQMGEGWSDFFGYIITLKPGDVPEGPRNMFNYVLPGGTDGSRLSPYSTDFAVNNFTYDATNDDTLLGTDSQGNPVLRNEGQHYIGFVWSTMLWDLTWAYIDKYGFDPDLFNGTGGNNKVMQVVIDGFKLQPCSPGFVDGRDAILAADIALTGGEDQCLIWEVFAARGLGIGASQGSAVSMTDQTEDFTMPVEGDLTPPLTLANCTTLSSESFNYREYEIYPNPTNDKLFINTNLNFGKVTISMIDLNGRIVFSKQANLFGEINIDISHLQTGLYILNIKGQGINRNDKIIKD